MLRLESIALSFAASRNVCHQPGNKFKLTADSTDIAKSAVTNQNDSDRQVVGSNSTICSSLCPNRKENTITASDKSPKAKRLAACESSGCLEAVHRASLPEVCENSIFAAISLSSRTPSIFILLPSPNSTSRRTASELAIWCSQSAPDKFSIRGRSSLISSNIEFSTPAYRQPDPGRAVMWTLRPAKAGVRVFRALPRWEAWLCHSTQADRTPWAQASIPRPGRLLLGRSKLPTLLAEATSFESSPARNGSCNTDPITKRDVPHLAIA